MNSRELSSLTSEAEVKAYLRGVAREHGPATVLAAAEYLTNLAGSINARAMWALDVVKELRESPAPQAKWHWPLSQRRDKVEYDCRHGVGHGNAVHGCDGCCADGDFPERA